MCLSAHKYTPLGTIDIPYHGLQLRISATSNFSRNIDYKVLKVFRVNASSIPTVAFVNGQQLLISFCHKVHGGGGLDIGHT